MTDEKDALTKTTEEKDAPAKTEIVVPDFVPSLMLGFTKGIEQSLRIVAETDAANIVVRETELTKRREKELDFGLQTKKEENSHANKQQLRAFLILLLLVLIVAVFGWLFIHAGKYELAYGIVGAAIGAFGGYGIGRANGQSAAARAA